MDVDRPSSGAEPTGKDLAVESITHGPSGYAIFKNKRVVDPHNAEIMRFSRHR